MISSARKQDHDGLGDNLSVPCTFTCTFNKYRVMKILPSVHDRKPISLMKEINKQKKMPAKLSAKLTNGYSNTLEPQLKS